mmetsp:Transcript_26037/g.43874  ORF Transcript_26037/g.43874 Transcript_26037/m.43874 type:complete len:210 (-) Transcript_26037:59-688(-)
MLRVILIVVQAAVVVVVAVVAVAVVVAVIVILIVVVVVAGVLRAIATAMAVHPHLHLPPLLLLPKRERGRRRRERSQLLALRVMHLLSTRPRLPRLPHRRLDVKTETTRICLLLQPLHPPLHPPLYLLLHRPPAAGIAPPVQSQSQNQNQNSSNETSSKARRLKPMMLRPRGGEVLGRLLPNPADPYHHPHLALALPLVQPLLLRLADE